MNVKRKTLILFSCCSVGALPAAWGLTYVVGPGDSLSKIAAMKIPGRVWGKNGSLHRLLAINPQIKNRHRIRVGQEIELEGGGQLSLGSVDRKTASVDSTDENASAHPELESAASSTEPKAPVALAPASIEASPQETPSSFPTASSGAADSFARHTRLSLRPQAFFTRLDGVDKTTGAAALVFSDQNYGVGIDWRQKWSGTFETFVSLDVRRISMRTTRAGQTLEGTSQTNSGLGAGLGWHLGEHWELGLGLFLAQELYFDSSASAETVRLAAVPVIEPQIQARYAWILPRPLGAGMETTARVLLPTSTGAYNTQVGSAFLGSLYVEQQLKSAALKAALYYGRSTYSSTNSSQVRSDIGLQFQASWVIGGKP